MAKAKMIEEAKSVGVEVFETPEGYGVIGSNKIYSEKGLKILVGRKRNGVKAAIAEKPAEKSVVEKPQRMLLAWLLSMDPERVSPGAFHREAGLKQRPAVGEKIDMKAQIYVLRGIFMRLHKKETTLEGAQKECIKLNGGLGWSDEVREVLLASVVKQSV